MYANDTFIVDCASPFAGWHKRHAFPKAVKKIRTPAEVRERASQLYRIWSTDHTTLINLHMKCIKSLKSHSLYETNPHATPAVKIISLVALMPHLLRDTRLRELRKLLSELVLFVLDSYDFAGIVADDPRLARLLTPQWRKKFWAIQPQQTKVYEPPHTPSTQLDSLRREIQTKLVRGHGAIPLVALPHPNLANLSPSATDLQSCLRKTGIKKQHPVLILSAWNTAWTGYVSYAFPHVGYSADVLPMTLFEIGFWRW